MLVLVLAGSTASAFLLARLTSKKCHSFSVAQRNMILNYLSRRNYHHLLAAGSQSATVSDHISPWQLATPVFEKNHNSKFRGALQNHCSKTVAKESEEARRKAEAVQSPARVGYNEKCSNNAAARRYSMKIKIQESTFQKKRDVYFQWKSFGLT